MNRPAAGPVGTGDRALGVDMEGDGEIGSRAVNGSKLALAQQKTMKSEVGAV